MLRKSASSGGAAALLPVSIRRLWRSSGTAAAVRSRLRSPLALCLWTSLWIASVANVSFWKSLLGAVSASASDVRFLASAAVVLVAILFSLLTLFSSRWVFKPFLVVILLLSAVVASFMDAYGVVIDDSMIHNVIETDRREAFELLTWPLLWHVTLIGVLPALLVMWTPVEFSAANAELRGASSSGTGRRIRSFQRPLACVASLIVAIAAIASDFKSFALLGRQHKAIRMQINPIYPLYSMVRAVVGRHTAPAVVASLAEDAYRIPAPSQQKRRVLIFVVGETARAKNFSLNGYARTTNPELEQLPVVSFADAYSCGTSTAISVRCMFSRMNQDQFDRRQADRQENVLDVLSRTGVSVFWKDNNSGCKNVCNRVPTQSFAGADVAGLCENGDCLDEVLLHDLAEEIQASTGDLLVILHPQGSHGPAYYKRTPDQYKQFQPECSKASLRDCERQSIVNAYDNTILYSDYLLAEVIRLLERNRDTLAGGMIYVSDHGESLGEHRLYLHGLPNMIAPDEQMHIPFLVWTSPELDAQLELDRECLVRRSQLPASHDNIFDSLLGMFDVRTKAYDANLDLFAGCRQVEPVRAIQASIEADD